jgi:hypothetical protein
LVTWQNPSAELYQPDNNSFVPAGAMIVPYEYWGYTAILLKTGNVLIAGGDVTGFDATTAELYDPSVRKFRSTGFLKQPRDAPTATLLPDGKVLMAGGSYDFPPLVSNTAEIYDSVDGTFTSAGEMVLSRTGHTATLLMDGRVLLAGGVTTLGYPLSPDSSAELYVPAVLSPAQVVTSVQFDRTSVVPGSSYSTNVSGSNLAPEAFFDVRFSAPGAKEFAVVLNWQRGVTASHEVPIGTASGTWTINGVRAHQSETDHSGYFVPVSAVITVSP